MLILERNCKKTDVYILKVKLKTINILWNGKKKLFFVMNFLFVYIYIFKIKLQQGISNWKDASNYFVKQLCFKE